MKVDLPCFLQKSQIVSRPSKIPTKIPENPELEQIDGIPSKSDEIQSTFQDPIETSEDQPNSSPGTRSTLKQSAAQRSTRFS